MFLVFSKVTSSKNLTRKNNHISFFFVSMTPRIEKKHMKRKCLARKNEITVASYFFSLLPRLELTWAARMQAVLACARNDYYPETDAITAIIFCCLSLLWK